MTNSQKAIDRVCEYRDLPKIKKGMRCFVDGIEGMVWGGNSSANLNVKFMRDGRVSNCHPYWRMEIIGDDGSVIYRSPSESSEHDGGAV